MKTKRVDCVDCANFISPDFKISFDIIKLNESEKAGCKLGKRVMFRIPKFSRPTNMVPYNDYGWIRYCNEFEAK